MEQEFDVLQDEKKVGRMWVHRQGLYYVFYCSCCLERVEICKIAVTCGTNTEILGTLIPRGDVFELRKTLPISRFKGEDFTFFIVTQNMSLGQHFIPIRTGEPFPYLSQLKHCYLQRRAGDIGVVVSDNQ